MAVMATLPYFLRRAVRMVDVLNIWSNPFSRRRDHDYSTTVEAIEQRSQDGGGLTRGLFDQVGGRKVDS